MSNVNRNLPSFGISKKPKVNNNIDPTTVEAPVTMTVTNTGSNRIVTDLGQETVPRSTTVQHTGSSLPPRSSRVDGTAGTSVIAGQNVTAGQSVTAKTHSDITKSGHIGEISFNDKDGLLYYYNGKEWAPLAIMDDEMRHLTESLTEILNIKENNTVIIEAPPRGNIHLIAGNNPPGAGGHVLVSAGQGGLADGEIYFTVGGDKAMTITKNADVIINAANMHVDRGDLVVKSGNIELEGPIASINCHIARAEISSVVKSEPVLPTLEQDSTDVLNTLKDPDLIQIKRTQTVPDVILNGMTNILILNLNLEKGDELSGKIRNSLLRDNSWINVSAVANVGAPYVWMGSPTDGEVMYTVRCMNGKLSRVQLHLEIRNSI